VIAAARAVFLESGYAGTTMRSIATRAGVSVPTVEASFGTKARLLKAAIDVAIVDDDEPVPVLARSWTTAALAARSAQEFLAAVAAVITPAQVRSAGLVLAAFEGAATEPDLAALETELIAQRAKTARWVVDGVCRTTPLRRCPRQRRSTRGCSWIPSCSTGSPVDELVAQPLRGVVLLSRFPAADPPNMNAADPTEVSVTTGTQHPTAHPAAGSSTRRCRPHIVALVRHRVRLVRRRGQSSRRDDRANTIDRPPRTSNPVCGSAPTTGDDFGGSSPTADRYGAALARRR
jgi:AcrR family transcriptional regulator